MLAIFVANTVLPIHQGEGVKEFLPIDKIKEIADEADG